MRNLLTVGGNTSGAGVGAGAGSGAGGGGGGGGGGTTVGTTAGKSLEAQLFDDTGGVRLLFFGRTHIPGIEPGAVVRATGTVGEYKGHLALANPLYELVVLAPDGSPIAG